MRMGAKTWAACLAVAYVLASAPGASAERGFAFAPDPQEVTIGAAVSPAEAKTSSDGLRYLRVSDQVILTGAVPVWHRQIGYQVDEERGLAGAGQVNLHYQPAYQTIQIHAVDVVRNGQVMDRREASRIETLRRESELEAGLIDGGLTVSITIPDIRLGDQVFYRYSVIGSNPVFGTGFHDTFSARYSTPLALREVRYVYPESMDLKWKADVEGFKATHHEAEGVQVLAVTARGVPAVSEEADTPAGHDPYGRIAVTTAGSWADVVDWALPLYPRRLRERVLADPVVEELRLLPADPVGSALRATAFVQGQVRYTGLDMGQNSHAPNPPELVLERRFGDCKDKATLLVALLAEAGIVADPVLVHSERRSGVRHQLPSPLAFDHVIVRARIAGEEVWIDPTLERERGSFADRQPLAYRLGLPIAEGSTDLASIPLPIADIPVVDVRQEIDFTFDGDSLSAAIEVVTDYRHAFAASVRDSFSSSGAKEVGEKYLDYMQGYYEGLRSGGDPSIIEDPGHGGLSVSEQYVLDWSGAQSGTGFTVVLFQILDWLPEIEEDARNTPFELRGPRHGRHSIVSSHPVSWSIGAETEVVENAYFRFERDVRVEEGKLIISGEWKRLADEVPAKETARVREDLEKVRDLTEYSLDLDPSFALLETSWSDWRWPASVSGMLGLVLAGLWLLRRRIAFAGMFYRPRRTVEGFLSGSGVPAGGLLLIVVTLLIDLAFSWESRIEGQTAAIAIASTIGILFALGLRWIFWSWLVKLAFRILGKPLSFSDLLRGGGWASAPVIVLMIAAMLALKFEFSLLDDEDLIVEHLPVVLLALVLMLSGLVWGLVSAVHAYAAVASVRRLRSFGAVALAMAMVLALLIPLVVLVALAG